MKSAGDAASAQLALDEAASALQDLLALPDDLRGAALEELFAYLMGRGWKVSPRSAEAVEELLEFNRWGDYGSPRIHGGRRRTVVQALEGIASQVLRGGE